MASHRIEDALQLLRAEYLDMPGLSMTPTQVARLLDLDQPTAEVILEALEGSHFLERIPDGRFAHAQHQDRDVANSH